MALLHALFLLLRQSVGKIIQALFGWASAALFGELPRSKRALVTFAVALAAGWPLLLLGIAFPKVAAFLIALVPLTDRASEEALRVVWIALALLAPLGVGVAISRGFARRTRSILSGYPITLGLAGAFAAACIVVPIRKISALLAREKYEHVPLAIPARAQLSVSEELRDALEQGGFPLERVPTPWSAHAMTSIARRLGGTALGEDFLAEPIHLRGEKLDLTLYPYGATLRGASRNASRAHALISEAAVRTRALQTATPAAQKLERRIKRIAAALERSRSPERARALVRQLLRQVSAAPLDYDEWEVLQRQSLQLALAAAADTTPTKKAIRSGSGRA